jgi:hypothetical protein
MRKHALVALVAIAALATIGVAVGSARTSHTQGPLSVHMVQNAAGDQVAVWNTAAGVAIRAVGADEVLTVGSNSVTYSSDGTPFEQVTYLGTRSPWQTVRQRLLLSRSQVTRALASPSTSRRLTSARDLGDPGPAPTTYTSVSDYGTSTAALAHAAPFAVENAGPSAAGHQLVDSYLMDFKDVLRNTDSGSVATFVYSATPSQFGQEGDDEIEINIASADSEWGRGYAASTSPTITNDDGTHPTQIFPGLTKVNAYQFVLHIGGVYVNITTTRPLNLSSVASLVSSLRSVS